MISIFIIFEAIQILYVKKRNEMCNIKIENLEENNKNLLEVNDHIIDVDLKKEHFDDPLEEFYNIVSMCLFMVKNDLYDEYFFDTYKEILEDYSNGLFDEYDIEDKETLDNDLNDINEYLKKDEIESSYYDSLSKIYDDKIK